PLLKVSRQDMEGAEVGIGFVQARLDLILGEDRLNGLGVLAGLLIGHGQVIVVVKLVWLRFKLLEAILDAPLIELPGMAEELARDQFKGVGKAGALLLEGVVIPEAGDTGRRQAEAQDQRQDKSAMQTHGSFSSRNCGLTK